jgi:hypothetical protein
MNHQPSKGGNTMGATRAKLILATLVGALISVLLTPYLIQAVGVIESRDADTVSPKWVRKTPKQITLPCDPDSVWNLIVKYRYKRIPNEPNEKIDGVLTAKRIRERHKRDPRTEIDKHKFTPLGPEGTAFNTLHVFCSLDCDICGHGLENNTLCDGRFKGSVRGRLGGFPILGIYKVDGENWEGSSTIIVICDPEATRPKPSKPYFIYLPPKDGHSEGNVTVPIYISPHLASNLDRVSSCSLSIDFPEHVTPLSVEFDSFVDSLFQSFDFLISGDTVSFFADSGRSIPLDSLIFGIRIAEVAAYVESAAPLLELQPIVFDSVHSGFYDSLGSLIDSIDWIDGEIFVAPYDTIPPVIDFLKVTFGDSLIFGDSGAVRDNNDSIPGWVGIGVQELYVDSLGDSLWLGVDWTLIDSLGRITLIQPMYVDSSFVLRIVAEDYWGNADTLIYVNSPFVCGDCTGDDMVAAGDIVYLIGYLFRGGAPPQPLCIGDANCNGMVESGDVVYLIGYLFRFGPPPCPDCCAGKGEGK